MALAWLDLWHQGEVRFRPRQDEEGPAAPTANPERQRYASYLRHQLAAIDAIAAGLPPRAN